MIFGNNGHFLKSIIGDFWSTIASCLIHGPLNNGCNRKGYSKMPQCLSFQAEFTILVKTMANNVKHYASIETTKKIHMIFFNRVKQGVNLNR